MSADVILTMRLAQRIPIERSLSMARIRVYLRIFWLVSKWPFKLCLGDYVRYEGRRWVLYQGVANPHWNLGIPGSSTERRENVHRKDFRKEVSFGNLIHDLRSGYRFYRGYWFDIWVMEAQSGKASAE